MSVSLNETMCVGGGGVGLGGGVNAPQFISSGLRMWAVFLHRHFYFVSVVSSAVLLLCSLIAL